MDEFLEKIAAELDSDSAGRKTVRMAANYVDLCLHFGMETPDWVRALAFGNVTHLTSLIEFCRTEKRIGS